MMLWSAGALVAAILTGSRGALAVALAAGCVWSGMRVTEVADVPHMPFLAFWLVGAALAVIWNSPVARHLVGVAALGWLLTIFIGMIDRNLINPVLQTAGWTTVLLGGGLIMTDLKSDPLRTLGLTLSTYGSFALALVLAPVGFDDYLSRTPISPDSGLIAGIAADVVLLAIAVARRRAGQAFAWLAMLLASIVAAGWAGYAALPQPWTAYALALASMLCLVVSGMLGDVRPRVVAGWLGLGLMIAGITWAVKGSLLRRAVFLAVAGSSAVVLALLFSRLAPKEDSR
jgi:hypothetical protein